MSEEANVETNDGTWSGLKKTIIGGLSTAILAGGTWVTTHLFGGSDESKEEHKTTSLKYPNFQKSPLPQKQSLNHILKILKS